MNKEGKILIVDDNEDVLFALHSLLSAHVGEIKVITKPQNIERFLIEFKPDIILLDMNFEQDAISGKEGFYWLDKILAHDSQAIVLLMTAYADTNKAVQAIKAGATDFIAKPWEKDKLLSTLSSSFKLRKSQEQVTDLKQQITELSSNISTNIIGESVAMQNVFSIIDQLSNTDANVLVLGENGTGKDLIAKTIHNNSPRKNEIFTSIDLGSISENLFESELFGYEKGAFTDAKQTKSGRMEMATGGTLFLNEIANLSMAMQAKLLTVIEDKTLTRLGAVKNKKIDVRYICATNADIRKSVANNEFRQDLLYRINTIEIHIPPLRDRGNDIILLAEHFLNIYAKKYNKPILKLHQPMKNRLLDYHWPGNVRELQSLMERAVILNQGTELSIESIAFHHTTKGVTNDNDDLNLERIELETIEKALMRTEGNVTKAAELLGISRYALHRKMNK